MNLNKYSKAELISKINKLDVKKEISKEKSITIWDILLKLKFWILSLTIIGILSNVFKKYKSIRAVLKLANYIILTMFGMSLFDAFGLGIIIKFFNESRLIFGSIIAYLTDSTFYIWLMKMFNISEEPYSVRSSYKKPMEKIDWKAELAKADREREIEEWKRRYAAIKKEEESGYTRVIILWTLVLAGSLGIWYYGRDALEFITPLSNISDLIKYYGNYTIFSEIKINEDITTILMSSNLDYNLINEIKDNTNLNLISGFKNVKSHVGIASAVTSYARIEMMELKMLLTKLNIKLYYTDTDSIFTDKEIPEYLIGKDLGQLKDELNGKFIKKGYFLGIKKYGYIDSNDNIHSIFSGVERNSLTWREIEAIANGFTVTKLVPFKFFKSFTTLNISIKNSLMTSIIFNPRKKLINNFYKPMKINNKILISFNYYLKIIKYRIISLINKYNLFKLK
jgi:hypothetical protein